MVKTYSNFGTFRREDLRRRQAQEYQKRQQLEQLADEARRSSHIAAETHDQLSSPVLSAEDIEQNDFLQELKARGAK